MDPLWISYGHSYGLPMEPLCSPLWSPYGPHSLSDEQEEDDDYDEPRAKADEEDDDYGDD